MPGHAQATPAGYHCPMTNTLPLSRSLKSLLTGALLATLAGAAATAPALPAQSPAPATVVAAAAHRPAWTLTLAGEILRAGDESYGFGPAISIRRDFGPRWGVELGAALPAFGDKGGGGAIDLGATYTWFSGANEVGAMLGATGFLVGDQSELVGGGVGLVIAAHASHWVYPRLGITAGANLRTAIGAYPSGWAGFVVRF